MAHWEDDNNALAFENSAVAEFDGEAAQKTYDFGRGSADPSQSLRVRHTQELPRAFISL